MAGIMSDGFGHYTVNGEPCDVSGNPLRPELRKGWRLKQPGGQMFYPRYDADDAISCWWFVKDDGQQFVTDGNQSYQEAAAMLDHAMALREAGL